MKDKKLLNIVVLPSWFPDDGGGFFKDHALILQNENTKVHILVNRVVGLGSGKFRQILNSGRIFDMTENGIRVSYASYLKLPKSEQLNMKLWTRRTMNLFSRHCRKFGKPDLIIAHSSMWAGYAAALIKKKYFLPLILVEHRSRFVDVTGIENPYFKDWYFKPLKEAFRTADKVVTVSNSQKAAISRIAGIPESSIHTIANPVDTDFFTGTPIEKEPQPFVFLSIGLLEHIKGLDLLLEAFANFIETHDGEFFLRIAGHGGLKKNIINLAKDLAIVYNLSFLGYISRERVRDEMQKANSFILPSRFEAFGVVLIEAMSAGLPVIATNSGGPGEIVNSSVGILANAGDVTSLEKAMEKMYLEYGKFNPGEIRKEAIKKYGYKTISEQYQQLILELLNEQN